MTDKKADKKAGVVERDDISSPVLRRLIKEVQDEKGQGPAAYNRIHNRHNRGR